MPSPAHEPLSSVDLAWLRMERAANPMMVVAVLTLASRVRLEAIMDLVASRLLRFARFRERPVEDMSGAHWEEDPLFDVQTHVHALELPPPARQAQLEAAASDLASTPLDPHHPLWQIHVVERYRRGSAVIARFHHCYADGIALLRVLVSLTDTVAAPSGDVAPAVDSRSTDLLSFVPFVAPAISMFRTIGSGVAGVIDATLHALSHPGDAATLARQITSATAELGRIAALEDDAPTRLKVTLGARKQITWARSLHLDEVKTVGRALGCTINDVLLATTAGAFGAYLRTLQETPEQLRIRALVPVNLRPPDADVCLGNRFGLVFAELPIGERNPIARLLAVHENMEALKSSMQPMVSFWLLAGMGALPEAIETQAIDVLTKKATLVISNVPGPQHPLHLAGARIDQQLFWVPQAGRIGIGVSLLTYDGRVHFGVLADRAIPDPRRICAAFVREFEKLLLCVVSMPPP